MAAAFEGWKECRNQITPNEIVSLDTWLAIMPQINGTKQGSFCNPLLPQGPNHKLRVPILSRLSFEHFSMTISLVHPIAPYLIEQIPSSLFPHCILHLSVTAPTALKRFTRLIPVKSPGGQGLFLFPSTSHRVWSLEGNSTNMDW